MHNIVFHLLIRFTAQSRTLERLVESAASQPHDHPWLIRFDLPYLLGSIGLGSETNRHESSPSPSTGLTEHFYSKPTRDAKTVHAWRYTRSWLSFFLTFPFSTHFFFLPEPAQHFIYCLLFDDCLLSVMAVRKIFSPRVHKYTRSIIIKTCSSEIFLHARLSPGSPCMQWARWSRRSLWREQHGWCTLAGLTGRCPGWCCIALHATAGSSNASLPLE